MRGVTISLVVKTKIGTDDFNQPILAETIESVNDVLVGEPSTDDIANALTLSGAKVVYKLAIPKGDTHDWDGTKVILPEPFAGTYKTVGIATAGIEANIPLRWNKKVLLERYEGNNQAKQSGDSPAPSI